MIHEYQRMSCHTLGGQNSARKWILSSSGFQHSQMALFFFHFFNLIADITCFKKVIVPSGEVGLWVLALGSQELTVLRYVSPTYVLYSVLKLKQWTFHCLEQNNRHYSVPKYVSKCSPTYQSFRPNTCINTSFIIRYDGNQLPYKIKGSFCKFWQTFFIYFF